MLAVHVRPAHMRQAPQRAQAATLRHTEPHSGWPSSTGNTLAHVSPQVPMLRCSHIPLHSRPSIPQAASGQFA